MMDVKGYRVDAKGYMVDVKGYSVDAKGPTPMRGRDLHVGDEDVEPPDGVGGTRDDDETRHGDEEQPGQGHPAACVARALVAVAHVAEELTGR
eukprot:4625059-Pyramimonas_sp.AAC.1